MCVCVCVCVCVCDQIDHTKVILPPCAGDKRDMSLIPGLGRSPEGGNGNPLQYFSLENSMDRGAWWATIHGVAQSQARLKRLSCSSSSNTLPHQKERINLHQLLWIFPRMSKIPG